MLLDSEHEVRPRVSEMVVAIKDVQFQARRHARLGGGGDEYLTPVGGDLERGSVYGQGKRGSKMPNCVTRMGALRLSNGQQCEKGYQKTALGYVYGDIRIPLGGIVDCKGRKARDRFGKPKGAVANDNTPPTVGSNPSACRGAFPFDDPVAIASEAVDVRSSVTPETAAILDLALHAANLRQVGEHLGFLGKTAERRGKAALLAACAELDEVLAA
ncbi:hypothetical protein [Tianweitania sediminis]|uniref:Uncharacterized protein n=1 Tax=Tianweitania sediminis TaxID=1502156 RepID=A0A8J7UKC3_9HYPH|nr:hypothetical protein [Tianweitania sediminis]MBP0439544.1 hypothetical protein [Tianweitania sediminis]